jgi:putative ABC transport system ATP-binding protein
VNNDFNRNVTLANRGGQESMNSASAATNAHRPDVPLIEARGLARAFPGSESPVQALRGVDLTIEAGEFVAIMGPSGCGKSTLLHLLGGLDRPTEGELWLNGRRVDRLSESQWAVLRRSELGFVFQFFNLIGNLTAADNVELPALLAGLSATAAQQRRIELFTELGIAGKAEMVPSRLSGGQQQRVALARALVNRPAILLADEPTGNLDSDSTRDVLALLRRLHAAGQTILIVTHDPSVASVADRLLTMRDGRIVDEAHLRDEEPSAERLAQLVRLEV